MPLISVISPNFPIAEEPYRGRAIYHTVLALQSHAEVEVYCPITVYPDFLKPRYRYRRADLNYRPPGIGRIRYLEYPAIPVLSRPWNGRTCAARLYPYLESSRPDLILNYWLYPEGYSALRLARRLGKPVIVGSRGSDLCRIQDGLTRRLVQTTVRNADRVVTVSEDLRQRAIAMGAAPERVRSIPNGCDSAVFTYNPDSGLRAKEGIQPGERVILFVGWLAQSKGILELLEAFRELAKVDSALRLVCIGEGALAAHITRFAGQNGLEGRIRLPGKRSSEDVARWMNIADVFCLPSHSEGCPNVVVEAITCGCPVVATTVGGTPELVPAGCGILTPPLEPGRLAEALRTALGRSWNRAEIARVSKRGWDEVAAETWALCDEVLKSRK